MKRLGVYSRAIYNNVVNMQKMAIPMGYYFKGSSNVYVHLNWDDENGLLTVKTDFGETIKTLTSANGLWQVLKDLEDDKYA